MAGAGPLIFGTRLARAGGWDAHWRGNLEQLLSDETVHDSNLFREAPGANATSDHIPAVDVSAAAMTRLRTPFRVEGDADRKPSTR